MADITVEAQVRTVVGKKVKQLRKDGFVPITVYGPKNDPMSLKVPYRALEIALMNAGGTNLIDMNVDGSTHSVLARDVQRDVLKGSILHADFFVVDKDTKIRADIPVQLQGESPAVAARKGILITGTNNVTIETLPGNLINYIEVDLTSLLEVGDSISVGDLNLGDDIVIINEPDEMLARVSQTSAARAELLDALDEGIGPEEGEQPEAVDEDEGEFVQPEAEE